MFQTGDVMWLDVTGARSGWVRDNGRTIGSATSGASERANADCESLFGFLWQKFSNTICPVSGGRGANAAADWAANKTIQLPDRRGCVPGGLGDMGNTDSGEWDGVPFESGDATTAGSVAGEASHVLIKAELPNATFQVSIPAGQGTHRHRNLSTAGVAGGSSLYNAAGDANQAGIVHFTEDATLPQLTGTAASGGTDTPHNTVQRTVLGTFYRKI